jgi:hypothetical protein
MWLRAIASVVFGTRDDAQPEAQVRTGDCTDRGFRPARRYTGPFTFLIGADGAYLRKTGWQPGLSRVRADHGWWASRRFAAHTTWWNTLRARSHEFLEERIAAPAFDYQTPVRRDPPDGR